ncbi:MAG: ATP-binding protein [Candidatus Dormibacteraceae bacterium]
MQASSPPLDLLLFTTPTRSHSSDCPVTIRRGGRGHRLPGPSRSRPRHHPEPGSGRLGERHQTLIVTGATGCGKSFLACALAQAAIRQDHSRALRPRSPAARGPRRQPGRRPLRPTLGATATRLLAVLDDFLLTPASVEQCRDLLEVVEDRAELRATLIASQLPVDDWHRAMADPTLAEAILDRVLNRAHASPSVAPRCVAGSRKENRSPPTTWPGRPQPQVSDDLSHRLRDFSPDRGLRGGPRRQRGATTTGPSSGGRGCRPKFLT